MSFLLLNIILLPKFNHDLKSSSDKLLALDSLSACPKNHYYYLKCYQILGHLIYLGYH